jgi:hypothetical protein
MNRGASRVGNRACFHEFTAVRQMGSRGIATHLSYVTGSFYKFVPLPPSHPYEDDGRAIDPHLCDGQLLHHRLLSQGADSENGERTDPRRGASKGTRASLPRGQATVLWGFVTA